MVAIDLGQRVAVVQQYGCQFWPVMGADAAQTAPRSSLRTGIDTAFSGAVHCNGFLFGLAGAGVIVSLTDSSWDADGIARFRVKAALLEGAFGSIDIGDVVNGLNIDMVNRVALDDKGINMGRINADRVKIRVGQIDVVQLGA